MNSFHLIIRPFLVKYSYEYINKNRTRGTVLVLLLGKEVCNFGHPRLAGGQELLDDHRRPA